MSLPFSEKINSVSDPLPFSVGIEIEFAKSDVTSLTRATYRGVKFPVPTLSNWKLKTDSSCGYEAVSPVFRSADTLISNVRHLCAVLKSNRTAISDACGIHVHFGTCWDSIDAERLNNMFRFFLRYENGFYALAKPSRKESYYCNSLPDEVTKKLQEGKGFSAWNNNSSRLRYTWLNGAAKKRHGTLEVRVSESHLRADDILGLVFFYSHVLENLLTRPDPVKVRGTSRSTSHRAAVCVHDIFTKTNSYGKELCTDASRATIAKEWARWKYAFIHGKSYRREMAEHSSKVKTLNELRDKKEKIKADLKKLDHERLELSHALNDIAYQEHELSRTTNAS